jgi:hypothetical protein
MSKRAKLVAALVAAIGLIVVTPLAAVAYWVVSAQLAVTAQASSFSIAAYSVSPATGSSTSFTGWADTEYFTAPLVNNGATPWAGQSVSVAAASGFGSAAVATVQIAFTSTANVCQNAATYNAVTAKSALAASTWTSTTAVASGATIYACVKLAVTDTDTTTASGQAAPAPTLTLTTTAKATQRNWADQEVATLKLSSTGWASCTTVNSTARLTLPARVNAGTYTIVRNDTGASFTGTVSASARTTLTLTNPAQWGIESAETYVTVRDSQGTFVTVANLRFTSSYSNANGAFLKSVACA